MFPFPANPVHLPVTKKQTSHGTYALVTLGCPKNLVDSERMAGLLKLDGYKMVREPTGADFVVINTCGFVAASRAESQGVIEEMVDLKEQGKLRGVIVTGCLAEREKEKLLEKFPGVDQLVGVFGRDEIATVAQRVMSGLHEQQTLFRPAPTRALPDSQRLRVTPSHLAYLKISEGCNRMCAFCSIPLMRGRHASKPMEEIVAEAEALVADGTREIVLVAQDLTFYGKDIYGTPRLAELLRQLDRIDGLAWLRLMYLYPMYMDDELLDVIASGKRIVPYIDMPLQHINDEMLKAMRRRVNRAETEQLVDKLRAKIDRLVLRTTFIAGFPGETEQQFQEMLDFVRTKRFERLGAFAYSIEPGTSAEKMEGHLPEEVKQARRDEILAVQQEIAFAWSEAQVGRTLDVIIDGAIPGQRTAFIGRSYADAPEIDGNVYVTGENLRPGQVLPCEIVAARGYDLIGVVMA